MPTVKERKTAIVADHVVHALLGARTGCPVLEWRSWDNPDECRQWLRDHATELSSVVVDAHQGFGPGRSLSACDGLRLAELLCMDLDFSLPVLVFGWFPDAPVLTGAPRPEYMKRFSTILSAEGGSGHLTVIPLPQTLGDLADRVDGANGAQAQNREIGRLQLARDLLKEEIERECRAIRHRAQNVLAAVRLLLGAFAAGDIDEGALQEALESLEYRDMSLGGLVEGQKRLSEVEAELRARDAMDHTLPQCPSEPLTGTVLIVDDNLFRMEADASAPPTSSGDFGWLGAHKALLTRSRRFAFDLRLADSYDRALALIGDKILDHVDVVILDVDLGDPDESGLHLLREIRRRDPFVPVLQMTAFDDAEVCQKSLELQADAFFVKQLHDRADRSSLAYYAKLVELLTRLLNSTRVDRELYGRFVGLLPAIQAEDQRAHERIPRLEDGVSGELTRLFMLMRMAGTHHLFHSLVTDCPAKAPDASHDELMLVLMDAVLAYLNWDCNSARDRSDGIGKWLAQHDAPAGHRASEAVALARKANCWAELRHHGGRSVTMGDVRGLLRSFLGCIEGAADGLPRDRRVPLAEQEPDAEGRKMATIVAAARAREQAAMREHRVRSIMGAEAVLLGRYLSTAADDGAACGALEVYRELGPELPVAEVICELESSCEQAGLAIPLAQYPPALGMGLIDDHARSSGWAYSTQVVHSNARLSALQFIGPQENQALDDYVAGLVADGGLSAYDVILLDLEMPPVAGGEASPDVGVSVGRILRRQDPLLPVVILSAHIEALAMREAVASGATAFFAKEAPGTGRVEDLRAYGGAFAGLPEELGLLDQDWLDFSSECRSALWELSRAAASGVTSTDCFLSGLCQGVPASPLLNYVRPTQGAAGSTPDLVQTVCGHMHWLLRRALFFLYVHREAYLSHWLPYFTAALPNLRPQLLGYDQLWTDAGIAVEYMLNVAALGSAGASAPMCPGEREFLPDQARDLRTVVGAGAYDAGLRIWNARNGRRYHDGAHAGTALSADPVALVREFIAFLRELGLVSPRQAQGATDPFIFRLREELQRPHSRAQLLGEKASLDEQLLQRRQQLALGGRHEEQARTRIAELEHLLDAKAKALEKLSPAQYLHDRRDLLKHLRPERT